MGRSLPNDDHLLLRKQDLRNGLLVGSATGVVFDRVNPTESYVVIPPAWIITDTDGAVWTFGNEFNTYGEINVLRNDVSIGEFAQWIAYHRNKVILIGKDGSRRLSHSRRHFI
jgi:hypothetical protein